MKPHAEYVPLHLHTEYSLLDGAIKIQELVKVAQDWRLPAMAITDHGNLFGAVEFYRQVSAANIKPILGAEVYLAPNIRERTKEEALLHLVLLARSEAGYRNLMALVSRAYTEGFYYKPRVDKALLEQYSGGLIALSACMKGEVPRLLLEGDLEGARRAALYYKHLFGPEGFYLELQENGLPEQEALNRRLYELAQELHIPVVATNDCHYLHRQDRRAHDILLCIQTGKGIDDPQRLRFKGDGLYFKSPQEMAQAFRDIPQALRATVEIAERCNVELRCSGRPLLPEFPTEGISAQELLRRRAQEGLRARFRGQEPPEAYQRRLRRELQIIERMGYASYFLIVWDFVRYAKERLIPVGPGRGSAAGSLVSWSLGITEIDPIRYGLLFERFLNPERVSMPDIDVDFCKERRGEILAYVARKYGQDKVAQIITFSKMKARAAVRDVGRVLGLPYAEVDKLAKLIPEGPKVTIGETLQNEPTLLERYQKEPQVRELLDIAQRLEGLARHASTHAAGVVISPVPLTELVPLYRNPSDQSIATQYDMGSVEALGLVKFDLLGLKTLTIIEKTIRLAQKGGKDIRLQDMPLDDAATYRLLSSGATDQVFQLESSGMKELLRKVAPERFEDLIALVALYRPGPLGSGMIEKFIRRRKGLEPVRYSLPQLEEILRETHGVILYQEQVMQIAHKVAGFSMGQADILRKAMGKKRPEEMAALKEAFLQGATQRGVPPGKAQELFEQIAFFAEYGFNKSHSAAYAYVAYQTAYLKAHYPVEFMAAALSAEAGDAPKVLKALRDCRAMGIEVLPPDINESDWAFGVKGPSIRFGLGAVKGVGQQAIRAVLKERHERGPFQSLQDFLQRLSPRRLNRKAVEALIKAGAFDSTGLSRKACMQVLEGPGGLLQESFFRSNEEWDRQELLRQEKEALGFYISGNPLEGYSQRLRHLGLRGIAELQEAPDRAEVRLLGMVTAMRKIRTSRGPMAYLQVEDEGGAVEVVVFSDLYREAAPWLQKDVALLMEATLEQTDKGPKLIARRLTPLKGQDGGQGLPASKMELTVESEEALKRLREGLRDAPPGPLSLYLRVRAGGLEALVQTSITLAPEALEGLRACLGQEAVKLP